MYKFIEFPKNNTGNGSLIMFQRGDRLPFEIKKVLVTSDMMPSDIRGKHAHYKTTEIVVALKGGCDFELDNGKQKTTVSLHEDTSSALLLYPEIWRTYKNFKEGTILLIIANRKYDESDYIRNYQTFLNSIKLPT